MSKIKVSASLVSPEASLRGMQMAIFSMCPHMAIPPCSRISAASLCVHIPSSYKDSSQIRLRSTLTASFELHHLLKDSISK